MNWMNMPLKSPVRKKYLGVVIHNNLSWDKQVCAVSSKSNRMLGFVRRNARCIKNLWIRRSIYLKLVRSHLGYATQVWAPQSIELVCNMERIQRRASKFILNLPFHCQRSYKDRLIQLNLLLLTYWQEYPDMVFLFKVVTGRVEINPTVTPWTRAPTRTSRHTSNPDTTLCPIRYCKTTNLSKIVFNRTSRIWNALTADLGLSVACSLSSFKAVLYGYYKQALVASYIPDDSRSFKSVCLTCNAAHNLGRNITCCV